MRNKLSICNTATGERGPHEHNNKSHCGTAASATQPTPAARPEIMPERTSVFDRVLVGVFVAVPLLALIAAVPLAWGRGLGWHDIVLAIAFYYICRARRQRGPAPLLHPRFLQGRCAGSRSRWRSPGAWPSRSR